MKLFSYFFQLDLSIYLKLLLEKFHFQKDKLFILLIQMEGLMLAIALKI